MEIDPLNNYASLSQIEEFNKYVINVNNKFGFRAMFGHYEELSLDAKIPIEEYNKMLEKIKKDSKDFDEFVKFLMLVVKGVLKIR